MLSTASNSTVMENRILHFKWF